MATPDSPNWSTLTAIAPYPALPFQKPAALPGVKQHIAAGPAKLSQSDGRLDSRYWVASQEGGQVVIRGAQV
jgi:hypothetical protein